MVSPGWGSALRSFLHGRGIDSLPAPFLRREAFILMFHSVAPPAPAGGWTPLRPRFPLSSLEQLLKAVAREHTFTTLEHVVAMARGETAFVPRSVALTFDDGHRNNHLHAWPLLRAMGVPATFFLPTGNISGRIPLWFDRLDYALQQPGIGGTRLAVGSDEVVIPPPGDRPSLESVFRRIKENLKNSFRDDREMNRTVESMLAGLEGKAGRALTDRFEGDEWAGLMTPEEVGRASRDGISFGSHTVDHVRIGILPDDVARDQLVRSRLDIERWTGLPCRHFCFPNGSYVTRSLELVREAGYDGAVTTREGGVAPGDDAAALPRLSGERWGPPSDILYAMSPLSRFLKGVARNLGAGRQAKDWSTGM